MYIILYIRIQERWTQCSDWHGSYVCSSHTHIRTRPAQIVQETTICSQLHHKQYWVTIRRGCHHVHHVRAPSTGHPLQHLDLRQEGLQKTRFNIPCSRRAQISTIHEAYWQHAYGIWAIYPIANIIIFGYTCIHYDLERSLSHQCSATKLRHPPTTTPLSVLRLGWAPSIRLLMLWWSSDSFQITNRTHQLLPINMYSL